MEFLMTYGWAILIMLVVIAVLFYLGVLSPGESSVKSCVFPAGFTCADFELDANGNLYLDVGQATGKQVTVTGVGCSVNSSPSITNFVSVPIRSGSHAWVTNSTVVNCTGASGSSFKGSVALQYSVAGSGLARTVTGTVSAPMRGNVSGGGSGGGSGSDVWILVPGNPSLGTSDFWVMKYEAKNSSGTPVSTAAGTPWVSISQTDAQAACAAVGGHLLTIAEAETINLNVAAQPSNWMSSVVGTGCMFGGHMECSAAPCNMAFNASSDDNQGYWNGTSAVWDVTVQHCPFATAGDRGNETRRTFYLSNSNVIWDWSGNVWEWMNDTCQQINWNTTGYLEWTNTYLQDYERPAIGPPNPPSTSWTTSNGVGQYYGCTANGKVFLRGGRWNTGIITGTFSVYLDSAGGAVISHGFRCAR